MFDTLDDPGSQLLVGDSAPQVLVDQMHSAWVSFVATGDPGWPAYGDNRTVMAFAPASDPTASGPVVDPRGRTERCGRGFAERSRSDRCC